MNVGLLESGEVVATIGPLHPDWPRFMKVLVEAVPEGDFVLNPKGRKLLDLAKGHFIGDAACKRPVNRLRRRKP